MLKFPGVVSAHRYKATQPEDRFQYVAVYEFESEETLQRFLASEHFAFLRQEYDRNFGGGVSERQRATYCTGVAVARRRCRRGTSAWEFGGPCRGPLARAG